MSKSELWFRRIEVENWRQFLGKHVIDFSIDPKKHLRYELIQTGWSIVSYMVHIGRKTLKTAPPLLETESIIIRAP